MQNKIKLLSVDAILLLAVLLSGCSEQGVPPNDPNSELNSILHNSSISENYTNNSESTDVPAQSSLTESSDEQSVTEFESSSNEVNSTEPSDEQSNTESESSINDVTTESSAEQSVTESESSFDEVNSAESSENNKPFNINEEVIWGLGKTFDEVSERYGGVALGGQNVYTFENGYGNYAWDATGLVYCPVDIQ